MKERLRALARQPFFSPAGFLTRAAGLAALFWLVHLCGGRDYATALAGGAPTSAASPRLASFFGLIYVLLYFVWLIPVPILVFASGLLWGFRRLAPTSAPSGSGRPSGTPTASAG